MSTGSITRRYARPSLAPDSKDSPSRKRRGRWRSAKLPVTIALATTGSVGVTIAPSSNAAQRGICNIHRAAKEDNSHIPSMPAVNSRPTGRSRRRTLSRRRRRATPMRPIARVRRDACSRIIVSSPQRESSSQPKPYGPTATPTAIASIGSESGLRWMAADNRAMVTTASPITVRARSSWCIAEPIGRISVLRVLERSNSSQVADVLHSHVLAQLVAQTGKGGKGFGFLVLHGGYALFGHSQLAKFGTVTARIGRQGQAERLDHDAP